MTEAKNIVKKRRPASVTCPEEKAKAFVEASRKEEMTIYQESLDRRIKKLEDAHQNLIKSLSLVADTHEKMADYCSLVDERFDTIEQKTWSLRIRNFFGL